jgi:hypothetical protein
LRGVEFLQRFSHAHTKGIGVFHSPSIKVLEDGIQGPAFVSEGIGLHTIEKSNGPSHH